MTTIIRGIDEEEDTRRKAAAWYNLATQALTEPVVSTQLQTQIGKIGPVSTAAINQTLRPSFYDGKKTKTDEPLQMAKAFRPPPIALPIASPIASTSLFPEIAKVSRAANITPGVPAPIEPSAPDDAEATVDLQNEAVKILKTIQDRAEAGEFSIDQIAEALDVPPQDIARYALEEAAHKLSRGEPGLLHNYPDVAREMLKLGLEMEQFKTRELEEYKKRGDEYREKMQRLLKFNALLDKLPSDKESYNLQELLVKPPCESLTKEEIEQCIKEVFPGASHVISKDQLSGGKVRTGDIMGEYRTRLTNLLTTEISVVIHNLQMITQAMQDFCKKRHQFVSSIIANSRKQ